MTQNTSYSVENGGVPVGQGAGGVQPGGWATTRIMRYLPHCEHLPRMRLPNEWALIRTTPWSMARAQRPHFGHSSHQSSGAVDMAERLRLGRIRCSEVAGRGWRNGLAVASWEARIAEPGSLRGRRRIPGVPPCSKSVIASCTPTMGRR